ncbi:SUMO-conjugating enzyme ubc9, partial [Tetrabaena socialis]
MCRAALLGPFRAVAGVCLSILKEVIPDHLGEVSGWRANFTVKTILLAVQELLSNPNFGSIANEEAYYLNQRSTRDYLARMRSQTAQYVPKDA